MVKHTIGKCNYCDVVYTKTWMKKHLLSCEKRQKTETEAGKKQKKGVEMYLLAVQAEYRPEFWLFVEVSATLKLHEIDQFLRDIWLECCGHLSQFRISNQIYACPDAQKDEKNEMNTSLKKALKGSNITKFSYEYDFGSTRYIKPLQS